jgi:GWxTD domain-containing protein
MSGRFVKNFSIYSAATRLSILAVVAALAAAMVLAVPGTSEAAKKKKKKKQSAEELTNFLLGPEYSQWLVGAIARIATEDEIQSFMRLTSDDEASAFVEEFWAARRSGDSIWPADSPQATFETRAKEADTLYSEGPRRGRQSDRGAVYILYGEPEEVKYEISSRRGQGPIEVWVYPKTAEPGLDGQQPERYYYFTKQGDYTVATIAPRRDTLRRPGGF